MAYNYGNYLNYTQYPGTGVPNYVTYTPQYQPQPQQYSGQMPQIPQQQPQPQNNTGFVWVQGEAGAKAYPVAAGNSVLLMDSENPVLYMKSTDASGRPLPIETYDLVKREAAPMIPNAKAPQPQIDMSQYVTMNELEAKVTEIVNKALGN